MGWYGDYKPYVPVAQRRAEAAREVARRLKKGEAITPVQIEGRKIASTFWGEAWCTNLESYSDFANRLPRGRTYVRNGSVVHLAIEPGRIKALVSGSSLYEVQIDIAAIAPLAWLAFKKQCVGQVGTLVELLQGKLSQAVMERVTNRDRGLFPKPQEIKMRCSCPDAAGMCKHLAAVMYGVGNRLDVAPELLFKLRGVNHAELIELAIPTAPIKTRGKAPQIADADLGAIFDIELGAPLTPRAKPKAPPKQMAATTPQPQREISKKPVAAAKPAQAAPSKPLVASPKTAAKPPSTAATVTATKSGLPTPKKAPAGTKPELKALKALIASPPAKPETRTSQTATTAKATKSKSNQPTNLAKADASPKIGNTPTVPANRQPNSPGNRKARNGR